MKIILLTMSVKLSLTDSVTATTLIVVSTVSGIVDSALSCCVVSARPLVVVESVLIYTVCLDEPG